tara:strand:- start:220 stop:477 length:258 start_codon:yes stop_codon:yes gene_type:complete
MERMSVELVANKIEEEKKLEIIDAVISNRKYMDSYGKYSPNDLTYLFKEWHNHFPQLKQRMGCIGCRKAVTKFWENVNNFWNSQN